MNEIEVKIEDFGLEKSRQEQLMEEYRPLMAGATQYLADAKKIIIKGEDDTEGMKAARAARLQLKNIRVAVEKKRKELKEASLREGKAIDGMANVIKFVIEPVETELQEKEDFVRLAEERRKLALAQERAEKLHVFGVDTTYFNLADMDNDAFASLLSSSEAGYLAKIEAERIERERIEKEKAATEEVERKRKEEEAKERARIEEENRKLRIEAEKARQEQIRLEKEKREADELLRKAEADRIKKEREAFNLAMAEREKSLRLEKEKTEAEAREREHKRMLELAKKHEKMKQKATCPECGFSFDID